MQSKILHFWQWFSQNEAIFRDATQAERAKEMLDNQILSFGKFAWGIDRGMQTSYVLTFSPNNDKNLFRLSKQIVQAAPNLPSWEFRPCKPPQYDWDFNIQLFNQWFIPQVYDVTKWKFVLIEEEDYRVTIEIKADNLETLDMDDRQIAASRAVTAILGEELCIQEVHSVKIVYQFDPQDKDWIYPMRELRKRFLYFIEEEV